MSYSLEKVYEVWDDNHGLHTEIGPDRDSLGLVELRKYDENNKEITRITFTIDEAELIYDAILNTIRDLNSDK